MIGNDIVDLLVARSESNWRRSGYLDKLFTPTEQLLIRRAKDADRQVWLLWSCKEAVYKAWSTEFGQRCYNPKALRTVDWSAEDDHHYQAVLTTAARTYRVQAYATPTHVCARTAVSPVQLDWEQHYHYPHLPLVEIKTRVRQQICQSCAHRFQWSVADIQLRKNELGRPLLYYQGAPSDVYLSWAHHGSRAAIVIGTPAS